MFHMTLPWGGHKLKKAVATLLLSASAMVCLQGCMAPQQVYSDTQQSYSFQYLDVNQPTFQTVILTNLSNSDTCSDAVISTILSNSNTQGSHSFQYLDVMRRGTQDWERQYGSLESMTSSLCVAPPQQLCAEAESLQTHATSGKRLARWSSIQQEAAMTDRQLLRHIIGQTISNNDFDQIYAEGLAFRPVIYHIKASIDRVRPSFLIPSLSDRPWIGNPSHAACVSGHATTAMFYALRAGRVRPSLRNSYIDAAKEVSFNREAAGVHYASDSKGGHDLAGFADDKLEAARLRLLAVDPKCHVIPPYRDGVVLKGYDVVAYHALQPSEPGVQGVPAHSHTLKRENATYTFHFVNEANRRAFSVNPEAYLPEFGGFCSYGIANEWNSVEVPPECADCETGWPWSQAIMGPPAGVENGWSIIAGRLYFNINPRYKALWESNAMDNIARARLRWQNYYGDAQGPFNVHSYPDTWQQFAALTAEQSMCLREATVREEASFTE